jgi:hypothetical protein
MEKLSNLNDSFIRLLDQWEIKNNEEAYFAIPKYASIDDIPRQGFKLHVTATILNCTSVAEKVIPYLLENDIQFKVVKDIYTLVDLNRGWLGYPQIGKFITIYPKDPNEFKTLAKILIDKTDSEFGPVIPTDKKIGDVLYYRFGSFHYKDGEKPFLTLPHGQVVEDKKINPIPNGIDDPLHDLPDLISNAELPPHYFITKALRKNGKGGVYQVLDFSKLPPVSRFMKESVPYGNMELSGVDAVKRMHWEINLTKELSLLSPAYPKVIDEFTCGEHHFFIVENRGKSLKDILVDKDNLNLTIILDIIHQLCLAVQIAHSRDIILRDLSLDNVLWDGAQISIVDLEYAYRLDGPELYPIGTPGFSIKQQMSNRLTPLNPIPQHDLYSIGAIWHTLLSPNNYLNYLKSNPTRKDMDKAWIRSELSSDIPNEITGMIHDCMENSCVVLQPLIEKIQELKAVLK